MPNNPVFKRYKASYIKSITFYQLPKFLFGKDSYFGKLSNDAKVLYSILRDRHELSLSNGWEDENHDVYLIYSRNDMADLLNMSQPTLRKVIKELIKYNLMEEVRQGLNKPNLIYLNYIEFESDVKKIENVEISRSEKNFQSNETVENARTEKNFHSREKESFSQEGKDFSPNLTEFNQPYLNQSINQEEITLTEDDMIDEIDFEENYEEIISNNIDIEIMKKQYGEIYEEIYNLVVDTVNSSNDVVVIGKNKIPIEKVIDRFLKLNSLHIEYVISCLNNYNKPIRNIKSFMLTCLYNATVSKSSFYTNQVQHTLYGDED
jgi:hypothetical protein